MPSEDRTLTKKLQTVRDTLTPIEGVKVYHHRTPPNLSGCIVWAEEGDSGEVLYADNALLEQIIRGRIFYWTGIEYDPIVDEIQAALNGERQIGWRLSVVEYDDELDLIYYEWAFEVI